MCPAPFRASPQPRRPPVGGSCSPVHLLLPQMGARPAGRQQQGGAERLPAHLRAAANSEKDAPERTGHAAAASAAGGAPPRGGGDRRGGPPSLRCSVLPDVQHAHAHHAVSAHGGPPGLCSRGLQTHTKPPVQLCLQQQDRPGYGPTRSSEKQA